MTWQSLGLALIEASIFRPVVLVLAVLIVLRVFRVRHPASQHVIWTAALVGMLLLPILSVWTPHWNIPILPVWRSFDRAEQPGTTVPLSSISAVAVPDTAPAVPFTRTVVEPPAVREIQQAFPETIAPRRPIPASADRKSVDPGKLVIAIYLTGLLAMLSYRAMGTVMLRRLLSRSSLHGRGVLRESGDVVIPLATGLFRPVVILPLGWREWDSRLRRVVLAHEFEHIRRRDTQVSAFGRVVTSLLWFHPLAWWMVWKISELSEMVCDMAAVKAADDPAAYAQMLLEFSAGIRRAGYRATLPGLAIAGSSGLGRRVERVLQSPPVPLRRLTRPLAMIGLIGVPVLCLAATLGVTGMPQQLSIVAPVPLPPSPPLALRASPSPLPAPAVATEQIAAAAPAPAIQTGMGAISGRLFLSDGSPAPNIEVVAMLGPVVDGGAKFWTIARRTRTDSEGRYRMDVPMGSYTISTMLRWMTTYYPGVTDDSRIGVVTVDDGQMVDGVNFRLDKASGVRVRGRIVPAPGAASSSILVGLGSSDDHLDPFSYRSYFADIGLFPVQPDGSFELPVVPQNVYAVRVFPAATANPRPISIFGRPVTVNTNKTWLVQFYPDEPGFRVDVARTDVIGLEIPFGMLVAAHIGMDSGDPLPAFVADRMNIKLEGPEGYVSGVSPTGSMVFAFSAGPHRISYELPFGYYMKTFSYGTTDLLRAPLNLNGPATSEIVGTITTTPPANAANYVTVRGHVTGLPDSSSKKVVGGPLFAFLVAPGLGFYGLFPLRDDGTFEFPSVPPGTYQGYVSMSGSSYRYGKTIVVANANMDGVELPIDPNVIHDKR